MPVETCQEDGKLGFRWGNSGACYTYNPSSAASKATARLKAAKQGQAIAFSRAREGGHAGNPTKKDFS